MKITRDECLKALLEITGKTYGEIKEYVQKQRSAPAPGSMTKAAKKGEAAVH
jgi:hypothetical protein